MNIFLCGGELPLGLVLMPLLEAPLFSILPAKESSFIGLSANDAASFLREHNVDFVLNLHCTPSSISTTQQEPPSFTQRVAEAASSAGITLFQLSNSHVFSGRQTGRHANSYRETDNPDNENTAMNLEALCPRLIVLRTGELFSDRGINILPNLLASWQRGESAALPLRDQFCPTAMSDAARVIVALLKQLSCGIEPWGVYHYCGTDTVSYHDFARLVRQILAAQPGCNFPMAIHDSHEGQPALSWSLDCSKIRNTFGIKQHAWRAGLASSIKRILSASSHPAPISSGDSGDTHGRS